MSTKTLSKRQSSKSHRAKTAQHRPAQKRRVYKHDDFVAGDLFSGFGGLTRGLELAGIETILAANHNEYKVAIHEANHPRAEHWVCDMVDKDSGDYHSPRDLPRVDLLAAGVSCFPAETLVLTKRGLVPIAEVVVGDEAWTHMQRWRPVTDTMSRAAETVILAGLGNRHLEATPNHGIWARGVKSARPRLKHPDFPYSCEHCGRTTPRWGRSATKARLYCDRTCKNAAGKTRTYNGMAEVGRIAAEDMVGQWWATPTLISDVAPPEIPEDVDWWWVGRWVGDGWVNQGKVIICCGHHETGELVDRLPGWSRRTKRTAENFSLGNTELAGWLTENFGKGAANKFIPTWLLAMPVADRQAFLDGYVSADGCVTVRSGAKQVQTRSVSKALSHGIRLLAAGLGHAPTVASIRMAPTTTIEGRVVNQRDQWVVTWWEGGKKRTKSRREDDRVWGRVEHVTPGRSDVDVFNITVDEDHTYVADGIVVFNCKNHSGANSQKAYASGENIRDLDDPEWEEQVTRSERDRATALCVLQYAEVHHPKIILVECTTELTSWGNALPNKPKVGDGTTYQWWMNELHKLGYKSKVLYLNSMFFGVPQSRDRIYIVFWDRSLRDPDLEHRPAAWCEPCDEWIDAVWTWRTGVPPSGRVRWNEQYHYTCGRCSTVVVPPRAPAVQALDFTNLGTRIGDRKKPLAPNSMERIRRCIERFKDFPAVLMPAKSVYGVDKHPWQPLRTQTSQQDTALVSTGALQVVAGNTFEWPGTEGCRTRDLGEPMWTQHATNSVGLITPPIAAVVPYRNGNLAVNARTDPMPTQTALEGLALLSAGVVPYRQHTIPTTHAEPMPTFTSDQVAGVLSTQQLLAAGFFKQNGSSPGDTVAHPMSDPLGTLTSKDTTGLAIADWHRMLDGLTPEECFYRMMLDHEVRDGCGFDKSFKVWGSTRDRVDGYGNAVSPPVGEWIGLRLKSVIDMQVAA